MESYLKIKVLKIGILKNYLKMEVLKIKFWHQEMKKKKMTYGLWVVHWRVAMQESSGSYNQILPWINMVGDISCCRFLHLECVINFTKNGQKGPFKSSQSYANLLSRHTPSMSFPSNPTLQAPIVTPSFCSIGHSLSF